MVTLISLFLCAIFAIFASVCIICEEMFGGILFIICSGICFIVFLVHIFMKILYGGNNKDDKTDRCSDE